MAGVRWTADDLAAYEQRKAKPKSGVQALKRVQRRSKLELAMLEQMERACIETPHCEHRPLEWRKYRLDFAWPKMRKGVEVQGMVHRIKGRFRADIEKRAELLLAGWSVLEVDGESIKDGRALEWLKRFLK